MNKVILMGRLTRDPELRTSGNGNSFVNFTIAVNRTFASSNGEREADFINCIAFNKQAENLVKYQTKGNLIGVEGQLRSERYEHNGQTKYKTYILVSQIEFLSSTKKEEKENPYEAFGNSIKTEFDVGHQIEITDEDIPF